MAKNDRLTAETETTAPPSRPARQMSRMATSTPKPLHDEAAQLLSTIRTNEANIGHCTRRGDHSQARALQSQTSILRMQYEMITNPQDRAPMARRGASLVRK